MGVGGACRDTGICEKEIEKNHWLIERGAGFNRKQRESDNVQQQVQGKAGMGSKLGEGLGARGRGRASSSYRTVHYRILFPADGTAAVPFV